MTIRPGISIKTDPFFILLLSSLFFFQLNKFRSFLFSQIPTKYKYEPNMVTFTLVILL
jgi:hypothetical protein